MMATRARSQAVTGAKLLDLFGETVPGAAGHRGAVEAAEHILLELADFVYTHTSLKPMSKTLFLISRGLLAVSTDPAARTARALADAYEQARGRLGRAAPTDDFSFAAIVNEVDGDIPRIADALAEVRKLTNGTDSLGLAFDTLLRGKWESGEGLGTFLTPEEVVGPVVDMTLAAAEPNVIERIAAPDEPLLFGDICGGTGRFVYHLAHALERSGIPRPAIERAARLYDQSCMAVDLGKLNFVFEGIRPDFVCVGDSLTDQRLSRLKGKFALLATNPPFGTAKYRWSRALPSAIPRPVLDTVGLRREGDATDPSLLFVFRNLDLLADGGALSIVLPDGVLHSPTFREALSCYEHAVATRVEVLAIVSLPPATFSLGGTVAKTSFVVFRKGDNEGPARIFLATARHVGFKKRGNRRVSDPAGNELEDIAQTFRSSRDVGRVQNWRTYDRLAPGELAAEMVQAHEQQRGRRLSEMVEVVRTFRNHSVGDESFHVSILDVDETGLIDIVAASRNAPVTRSLECQPGDILLSCLNPKIWRVAVVPNLPGTWTCSAEFIVLRPKTGEDPWHLLVALHQKHVREAVQSMASGTSSSRQRVRKSDVAKVMVPALAIDPASVQSYARAREEFYSARLREARAFARLHAGCSEFHL